MTYHPGGRPLVISDCDEVLLYMVEPFKQWLDETQDIAFHLEGNDFSNALRAKDTGEPVEQKEIWRLLNGFFDTEMPRQSPIPGAVEAMAALMEHADVVILTNLLDTRRETRAAQLRAVGIDARVYTNQGPKGPAIAAILEEWRPSHAVFIDDLAQHHGSAREIVPHVTRLHLCGEPTLAPHITCGEKAGDAHARIDTWNEALPWILERIIKIEIQEEA